MAKTELHNYTVQEKLNKMDVDIIEVDVDAESDAANDLIYIPTEIPNAVAVKGGTCLIQSVTSSLPMAVAIDQSHNLIISNVDTAVGVSADTTLGSTDVAAGVVSGIQAIIPIPAGYSIGTTDSVASVLAVGAVAKAAEGSTSLWVWGIATSSSTIDATISLKFGIVKD